MLDQPAIVMGAEPERGPATARPAPTPRDSLSGFISALRQRRAIFLAVLIAIPLCTYLTLRQIAPRYTATGQLIYEPSEFRLQELQSILHQAPTTEAMMASQAEILHGQRIVQDIDQRLKLSDRPEFNPAKRPSGFLAGLLKTFRGLWTPETPDPDDDIIGPRLDPAREAAMHAIQTTLEAVPIRFSHVIEVRFTSEDPVIAAAVVNDVMDQYIKDQYKAKYTAVEDANKILKTQADHLRSQVRRIEEQMSAYRTEHSLGQGMHAGIDTEEITHLTEDLSKAQSERAAADARLDAARGKAGAVAQAEVAPSVARLREQSDQLAGQVQAQSIALGAAHPVLQGLKRQQAEAQRALAAETTRVVAATEAEQRAASERVTSLEAILARTRAAAEAAARTEIPLNAMNRDLEAARGQLQAVLDRMQQTAQQAAVENPGAHEVSLALVPDHPSYPRTAATMAASSVAAVFLGLLLIHILQLTDTTLHSGDEVRRVCGLRCLALIPEVRKRSLRRVKLHEYATLRPHTTFAEQVRSLRAGISLSEGQPQVIAITAARPSEGKTLLTVSLGRSAQAGGEKVLIIECDVRQSTFRHHLQCDATPGLMEILRGESKWTDAVRSDLLTGMNFITAGKSGGDVLRLFLSDRMRAMLAEARDQYDLILLDLPPVEAMTEARIAAALADGTLMCVRWQSTRSRTLLHAMEILCDSRAKIVGSVLTRVDPRVHLRSGYADAGVYHRRYRAYFRE